MRARIIVLAAVLSLGTAAASGAVTLYLGWDIPDGIVGGYVGVNTFNAQAGAYTARIGGPNGLLVGRAYCADVQHGITLNRTYEYTEYNTAHADLNMATPDGYNRGEGARAAWLVNTVGVAASNAVEAGAVQVALWEVLYDTDDNILTGHFRVTGWGLGFDPDLANSYVAASIGQGSTATYFQRAGDAGQDLIHPVPEPTTIGLLGFGLLFGGLWRRRPRT